ncbi:hypothetical protein PBY51_004227 [Eleginops maclovinus]|uniref:Uncharacterized protein n=1 Tax=Eleginops maclovinus TaxID=56733 RepID=A0AAN7Y1N4_ELEMC|nr:hypothetical protein PBY51_004227 [Eleginops maclovinus]
MVASVPNSCPRSCSSVLRLGHLPQPLLPGSGAQTSPGLLLPVVLPPGQGKCLGCIQSSLNLFDLHYESHEEHGAVGQLCPL